MSEAKSECLNPEYEGKIFGEIIQTEELKVEGYFFERNFNDKRFLYCKMLSGFCIWDKEARRLFDGGLEYAMKCILISGDPSQTWGEVSVIKYTDRRYNVYVNLVQFIQLIEGEKDEK